MAEQSTALYVGSLPRDIDEEKLYHLFHAENAPQIASLRIVRSPDNSKDPYAYLNFHTGDDADKVLRESGFKVFNGKDLILQKWSKPGQWPSDANVYAQGDFSIIIETKEVYEYFTQQFPCVSFKPRDAHGGKKSFYIQYEKTEDAAAVIKKVSEDNGIKIGEVVIEAKVELFKKSGERIQQTNVFVRNFPVNYTKKQFTDLVSKHGEVDSIYLPERFAPKPGDNGPSKTGYGHANYKTPEQAKAAIEKLNQERVGDFQLQAFFSVNKEHRKRQVQYNSANYQNTNPGRPYANNFNNKSRCSLKQQQRRLAKAITIRPSQEEASIRQQLEGLEITRVNQYQTPYSQSTLVVFTTTDDARTARERLQQEGVQVTFRYPPARFQQQRRRQFYRYPRYMPHPYMVPYPHHPHAHPGQMMPPYPQQMMQQQQPQQATYNTRRRVPRQHQQQQAYPEGSALLEDERQTIGSALYYKIQNFIGPDANSEVTGKITGMLLELSAPEVRQLALPENEGLLQAKVSEARVVLGGQQM